MVLILASLCSIVSSVSLSIGTSRLTLVNAITFFATVSLLAGAFAVFIILLLTRKTGRIPVLVGLLTTEVTYCLICLFGNFATGAYVPPAGTGPQASAATIPQRLYVFGVTQIFLLIALACMGRLLQRSALYSLLCCPSTFGPSVLVTIVMYYLGRFCNCFLPEADRF